MGGRNCRWGVAAFAHWEVLIDNSRFSYEGRRDSECESAGVVSGSAVAARSCSLWIKHSASIVTDLKMG